MFHGGKIFFSSNYRSPGLPFRVHHPHVVDRSWDKASPNRAAVVSGLAKFIPRNFKMQQFVESVRTGEFLGHDYPYNLLPDWANRRYNVVHKPVPENVSLVPRVDFYARLNVWAVAWRENGKEYHRWFRVQVQGFKQAKYKAETFRRMLEASGRIDGTGKIDAQKQAKRFARTRLIRRDMSIPISVVDKDSGRELTVLNLPPFCLDHMRAMSLEANRAMLRKYVQASLKDGQVLDSLDDVNPDDIPNSGCVLRATVNI